MTNPARTLQLRKSAPAPAHLKVQGQEHWQRVVSEFPAMEAHELTILEAACVQLDRAAEFRSDVEARGAMVPDRFGILKANPAIDKERQALDAFRQLNRELGLSTEPAEPRPPLAKGFR